MSLHNELELVNDFAPIDNLSRFQQNIPAEWIEEALNATGTASIRTRKLPAEQVVWLVLGMGLFRDRSIQDLSDKLNIVLPDREAGTEQVAPSAVVQARARLGSDPLRYLFLSSAQAWCQHDNRDDFCGLKLLSVDGTLFQTPDSADNVATFGCLNNVKGFTDAFPSVRLVALLSVHSHLLWDVAFGSCREGEIRYAEQLVGSAPAQSLTLFDRCYFSAELLLSWQQQQRDSHWLIPLKTKVRHTVIKQFSAHDCLIEMPISPQAREQHPHLPLVWRARMVTYKEPKGPIKGFLTSLLDPEKYPTTELLRVYWQRWEIEEGYGEIKTKQLRNEVVLRSQTAKGIQQELWGILLAYNILRLEISRIASEANTTPQRISFIMALRYIQDEFMWLSIASPGTIPTKLRQLRENVKRFIIPERKRPSKPRAVRTSRHRYPILEKPKRA